MQAVGNDFVLLDGREVGERDWPALALRMCDRRFGVGGDGLLVVAESKTADFRFRMFNPDGTEDTCGNGLRCAIKYWFEKQIPGAKNGPRNPSRCSGRVSCTVEQRSGRVTATASLRRGMVTRITASMGAPRFEPSVIPLSRDRELVNEIVNVGSEKLRMTSVSTGTAHTVIFVKRSPLRSPVPPISAAIETHPLFPERTSVLWTYVRNRSRLEIGIWERGVGETLGCGTGACAAAAVAHRLGLTGPKVRVTSKGGQLQVECQRSGTLLLTGDAVEVFRRVWAGQG